MQVRRRISTSVALVTTISVIIGKCPLALASLGISPESTSIHVVAGVHQVGEFPLVTPDGQYLLVSQQGKQWLEAMNGQKFSLPSGGNVGIYGSTLKGDVILRYSAGGGPLWYVFSVGKGTVQPFPPKRDAYANSTFTADENSNGNWAVGVTDVVGTAPFQPTWVDIDGRSIPNLQNVLSVRWSPNGKLLGVLAHSNNASWLEDYNPQTGTRILGQNTDAVNSQQNHLGAMLDWSPNGRYLATMGHDQIAVFDTVSNRGSLLSVPSDTLSWGFSEQSQLFTVASGKSGDTNVTYYQLPEATKSRSALNQHGVITYMASAASNGTVVYKATVPEKTSTVVATSTGLTFVQNIKGAVYEVKGRVVTQLVFDDTDSLWYDEENGYLYYGLKSKIHSGLEPVKRIRIN